LHYEKYTTNYSERVPDTGKEEVLYRDDYPWPVAYCGNVGHYYLDFAQLYQSEKSAGSG
jgi:hypothetical protein